MTGRAALVLGALVLSAATAGAQRRCTRGIPCGNSCISADKVCRIGGAPAPSPSPPAAPAPSNPAPAPPPPSPSSPLGLVSTPASALAVPLRMEYLLLQLTPFDVTPSANGRAKDGWRVHSMTTGRVEVNSKKQDGLFVLLERPAVRP